MQMIRICMFLYFNVPPDRCQASKESFPKKYAPYAKDGGLRRRHESCLRRFCAQSKTSERIKMPAIAHNPSTSVTIVCVL
jgi:hypothetical protein